MNLDKTRLIHDIMIKLNFLVIFCSIATNILELAY